MVESDINEYFYFFGLLQYIVVVIAFWKGGITLIVKN